MRQFAICMGLIACFFMLFSNLEAAIISLSNAYSDAEPGDGVYYDKVIVLDNAHIYTGDLPIINERVLIQGNGSVIDFKGSGTAIWTYQDGNTDTRLDITNATLMNGSEYAISYAVETEGSITNCNFINNKVGIVITDHTSNSTSEFEPQIVVTNSIFYKNYQHGIFLSNAYAWKHLRIYYSNTYDNGLENPSDHLSTFGDFYQNCIECGGEDQDLSSYETVDFDYISEELLPNEDPLFLDFKNTGAFNIALPFGEVDPESDLTLANTSPCKNMGAPTIVNDDGSRSHIGAYQTFSTTVIAGDLNNDAIINVLDIVAFIPLVLNNDYNETHDINQDGQLNVLDVVSLVNVIIEN